MFRLLKEKEYKNKEIMKLMGLSDFAYYSSWIFHYSLIFVIIGLGFTYEIVVAVFKNSNFVCIFLWFLLFYM